MPETYQVIFDQSDVELTGTLYHVFFAAEFKINDKPHAEAENQCIRAGSAMNFNAWKWNVRADKATEISKGKSGQHWELDNTFGQGESKPDMDSVSFTVAVSPTHATLFVNWREEWQNGAVYWHASVLEILGLAYGCDQATARFQRYVSNIFDWGVGERAERVFRQASAISQRKAGQKLENPRQTKRQRTS